MKRIVSLVLCLVCVFCLCSCTDNSDALQTEKTIAVAYGTSDEFACEEYVAEGFTKVTYNSSSDVVLAVENGKSDCGVLNEFELNSFINAERNIKKKKQCEYSIDYCAYFSADNENLQESFNEAIESLSADGTLDKIKNAHFKGMSYSFGKKDIENGAITMLCDPNFENRVYTDESGNIIGLDVDVARGVCNYLGYDLEIVTADFDELFTKMQEGEGDFIITACEVNEERAEYYLLSDTYFTLNFYLIEKA